jgi:hypothetical protein
MERSARACPVSITICDRCVNSTGGPSPEARVVRLRLVPPVHTALQFPLDFDEQCLPCPRPVLCDLAEQGAQRWRSR